MQVVSASGDGSVKLFDLNTRDNFPVAQWHEHQTEVSGVHWNLVRKDTMSKAATKCNLVRHATINSR